MILTYACLRPVGCVAAAIASLNSVSLDSNAQVFGTGPSDPSLFTNGVFNIEQGNDPGFADNLQQFNFYEGPGVNSNSFMANAGSEVNIYGGVIEPFFNANSGSEINIIGGRVRDGFVARAGSQVNVNGGEVESGLFTFFGSEINVSGGHIGGNFSVGGEINVTGGSLGDVSLARSGSVINISGGRIADFLEMQSGSEINIRGGAIGTFAALNGSEVNLFGTDFAINGTAVPGLNVGQTVTVDDRDVMLTGILADGSPFVFDLDPDFDGRDDLSGRGDVFQSSATVTLTLVDTLTTALGDYSGNGVVDAADYTVWADSFGNTTNLAADGNGDGVVDAADYTIWADNFGSGNASVTTTVPEPAAGLFALSCLTLTTRRRRTR